MEPISERRSLRFAPGDLSSYVTEPQSPPISSAVSKAVTGNWRAVQLGLATVRGRYAEVSIDTAEAGEGTVHGAAREHGAVAALGSARLLCWRSNGARLAGSVGAWGPIGRSRSVSTGYRPVFTARKAPGRAPAPST